MSCAFRPTSCDLGGIVLCNVTVSLSLVGYVISVAWESGHHVTGNEVEEIEHVLSTIGLGAVAIVPPRAGWSVALKAGAGLLKAAKTGIDWSLFVKSRPATFSADACHAIHLESLAPVAAIIRSAGEVRVATATRTRFFSSARQRPRRTCAGSASPPAALTPRLPARTSWSATPASFVRSPAGPTNSTRCSRAPCSCFSLPSALFRVSKNTHNLQVMPTNSSIFLSRRLK